MKSYKTIKQRIKDKHINALLILSREVNFVFNFVNNLSYEHTRRTGKFFSAFDLATYTKGCTDKDLGENKLKLHSQTVQAINEEYVARRKQFKKAKLNWRVSNKDSSKYSLGWIPFKSTAIQIQHGQIKYGGKWFNFWDSYGLVQYKDKIKTGCFVEDSRGRWYVCLVVEVEVNEKPVIENLSKDKIIGIDPGLKTLLTITNGIEHSKIEPQQHYRHLEQKLGIAQRANKKNLVKSIHAKIKNKRSNDLHQLSSHLVKNNQAIFIGDVSPKSLIKKKTKDKKELNTKDKKELNTKTKEVNNLDNKPKVEIKTIEKLKRKHTKQKIGINKSVLDAGWSIFRNMLEYKCNHAGVYYSEIDEKHTTQDCSCCGSRHSSPKGRAGLGIREWTCKECNTLHDRDINAAKNILVRGHAHLAGGIPAL